MAFWLDRFKKDDEDIWEELKQMLINSDALETQKKLQEAREFEAFNKAWDEPNGVDVEVTSQTNLNPSQQSIQKPMSNDEWLEEVKRKRKKRGWW